jgi:hypothetical protein
MQIVKKYFNRVVLGLDLAAGIAAAIAVPVANLDLSSTAGVVAGLGAVVAASVKFLSGWQAHEAQVANMAVMQQIDQLPHTVPSVGDLVEPLAPSVVK